MKYTIPILFIVGNLFAQDSTGTTSSTTTWSSTVGLTLTSPWDEHLNLAISYRFPNEIKLGMIRISPHLTFGWHQNFWESEQGSYWFEDVHYIDRLRNRYDLNYLMLGGHIPILESREADLHLNLGFGLGRYTLYSSIERNHPEFDDSNEFEHGPDFIVSAGLRARYWKIIGETQVVFHGVQKGPVYTVNLGYNTNNPLIAALIPLGGMLALILVMSTIGGPMFF
ncbi:MAG: hypothetical protein V3W14_10785 [Candidatus Neomarinimicrobiota bacterium]